MECKDKHCPVHGSTTVRGNVFTGVVVSDKMQKSAVIEIKSLKKSKKYERLMRSRSRMSVHVPDCIQVHVGNVVEVGETRKISKTKNFVVLKVLEGEKK